jgi:hypothetical protein
VDVDCYKGFAPEGDTIDESQDGLMVQQTGSLEEPVPMVIKIMDDRVPPAVIAGGSVVIFVAGMLVQMVLGAAMHW